jgi:hypothetical protein
MVISNAKLLTTSHSGRNGGHLTPISFSGFASLESRYGCEDTLANAALEQYVYSELQELSKVNKWSQAIDLVINKRTVLLLTESDKERVKHDYDRAQRCGLPLLDQIDWLEPDEVQKVILEGNFRCRNIHRCFMRSDMEPIFPLFVSPGVMSGPTSFLPSYTS